MIVCDLCKTTLSATGNAGDEYDLSLKRRGRSEYHADRLFSGDLCEACCTRLVNQVRSAIDALKEDKSGTLA